MWTKVFILSLISGVCAAQVIAVPNPAFESGSSLPDGWQLSGGTGQWLEPDASGGRAVSVTGTGDDSNFWQSPNLSFEPSALYSLRFDAKGISGSGGTAIAGPDFCNRDLGQLAEAWTPYHFVFAAPLEPSNNFLRFGQWHVQGAVAYDNVELARANAIYRRYGDIELGEREHIQNNRYEYISRFSSVGTNFSRPLVRHTCGFNTFRWAFAPGNELVYRHVIGSRNQTAAAAMVDIGNRAGGDLSVECSLDGQSWRGIGSAKANGAFTFDIPKDMLPAKEVWVRFLCAAAPDAASPQATTQIIRYSYEATLELDASTPTTMVGETHFVEVLRADRDAKIEVDSIGSLLPGVRDGVHVELDSRSTSGDSVATLTVRREGGETRTVMNRPLFPGRHAFDLPYTLDDSGAYEFDFRVSGGVDYHARVKLEVPQYYAVGYGERLSDEDADVGLWWASSGWKICPDRPVPKAKGKALTIRAARKETEAAQLVIRPKNPLNNLVVTASQLRRPNGAVIPASSVEILRVRYVPITVATDGKSVAGYWPDPLPKLAGPITVAKATNQPLWVRVTPPADAVSGIYTGVIELSADGFHASAPIEVEVFDFTLPARMTCVTTFGFSAGEVYRYQKLSTPEQQRAVIEKYFDSFQSHHISPYDPAPFDAFQVAWPEQVADDGSNAHVAIDWSAWDAAMTKAIDERHFNSFIFPVQGMGGGTFFERTEPSLHGFAENTPQYKALFADYCRQAQEHLREKGWLDEAYIYWFDEPDPKDYEFVMNGFRKLKEFAPDIPRMLTEQVEPHLVGGPNVWCPITPEYKQGAAQERQKQGDRIWWYVCTGPKAPYATLFIDHPATELRVWLWQTWQRNIEGILVWQSNYWSSSTAYPDSAQPQNPYEDPMSWTVGYGIPSGQRQPWGNGDGRFLYPPEAAATGQQVETVLEGPVETIRWEMLRDGVEDYEYLVMLKRLIAEKGATLSAEEETQFEALLTVPESITTSMIAFTESPEPIESQRLSIARAIERLNARP